MDELFINRDSKEVMRLTLPIGTPLNGGELVQNSNGEMFLFADEVTFYIYNP